MKKNEISEIKKMNAQNELQDNQNQLYDLLTQVYNRETVKKKVINFLDEKPQGIYALLIIDIDGFKKVNDCLGSLFGDRVLSNFASQLQKIAEKEQGIVGRIGGDKFQVFIKNTEVSVVEKVARKICSVFEYMFAGTLNHIDVYLSVGISIYPEDGCDALSLFQDADAALQVSKKVKRNQYTFFKDISKTVKARSKEELQDYYKMMDVPKKNQSVRKMIEFAFHILTETKDVKAGIGLVLQELGQKLDVQTAMIFEKFQESEQKENEKIRLSFLWEKERGIILNEQLVKVTEEEWNWVKSNLDKDGFYEEIEAKKEFKEKEEHKGWLSSLLRHIGTKSILIKGLYEETELKLMIAFFDEERERQWTEPEKYMITMVSKLIFSYLFQIRIKEQVENKVNQLINFDNTTDFYKLSKFKEIAEGILKNSIGSQEYILLYSDIRNFRNINDTYGYEKGDEILRILADTFRQNGNFVLGCRVFADHFIVLLKYNEYDNFMFYMIRLLNSFLDTVSRNVTEHNLKLSSGVCLIEDLSMDISQIIDNADLARKKVRKQVGKDFLFYDEQMAKEVEKKRKIELSMERALENGEFCVFMQSKHDLKNKHIIGAEALIRWKRGKNEIAYPDEFIPLFERNGFISQIDFYVLDKVCSVLRERLDKNLPCVVISVNQSRYLLQDRYYVEKVKRILDNYQIPSELIELELTESLFFEDARAMIDIMRKLKKLGVSLSIDDFGAGYSSLNVLKDLPADVIKIDKAFLENSNNRTNQVIITKTVEMAKLLDKKIICEGVETEEQADFLRNVQCDFAQGYLFSRPVPYVNFFDALERDVRSYE